jgi:hypothetical protein
MTLHASKACFYIQLGILNKPGVIASVLAPPQQHSNQRKPTIIGKQIKWSMFFQQCFSDKKIQLRSQKNLQLHSRLKKTTKSCSISQTDYDGFPKCIHKLGIRTTAWRNSFRLIGIGFCWHIVVIPVTPSKVSIPYATHPYEVMQGTTCNNDLTLYMGGITRDFFHHLPLYFQHSK